MSEPLRVRPATAGDSAICAELIHAAAPAINDLLYGGSQQARSILGRLCASERGIYSYRHIHVGAVGDTPAGMVLAFDSTHQRRLRRETATRLLRIQGPLELMRRLPAALAVRHFLPPLRAASLYIHSLAVSPEARGQGLGRTLLQRCQRRADAEGLPSLTLDVKVMNSAAIRLYSAFGFVELHERGDAARESSHGLSRTRRMVKRTDAPVERLHD